MSPDLSTQMVRYLDYLDEIAEPIGFDELRHVGEIRLRPDPKFSAEGATLGRRWRVAAFAAAITLFFGLIAIGIALFRVEPEPAVNEPSERSVPLTTPVPTSAPDTKATTGTRTGETDASTPDIEVIAVGVEPEAAIAGGGAVWSLEQGQVSRIDVDTNMVETIPIDGTPQRGLATQEALWVVATIDSGDPSRPNHSILKIPIGEDRVTDQLGLTGELDPADCCPVLGDPVEGPDGSVWLIHTAGAIRIDSDRATLDRSIAIPGAAGFASDADNIWIAGLAEDSTERMALWHVNMLTGDVKSYPAASPPAGAIWLAGHSQHPVLSDGAVWTQLFSDNGNAPGLWVRFDIATMEFGDVVTVTAGPGYRLYGVPQVAAGVIWWVTSDGLTGLDLATNTRTAITLDPSPGNDGEPALLVAKRSLWVTTREGDIFNIDPLTRALTVQYQRGSNGIPAEVPTDGQHFGRSVVAAGALWVPNTPDGTMIRIELEAGD